MLFFFCFTQKTAYEMRISDWSSDVCSSDLVAGLRLDTLAERQRRGAEKMDVDIAGAAEAGIFEMVMFEVADRVRHIRLTRDEGLFPDRLEIGRASCRERVCKNV